MSDVRSPQQFKRTAIGPRSTDWRTKSIYKVLQDDEHVGYVVASMNSSKTGSSWTAYERHGTKPIARGITRAEVAAAFQRNRDVE